MKYRKVETFQKSLKKHLKETPAVFLEIKCSRYNQFIKQQEEFFITSFTDMTVNKTLPPYHMVNLEARFTYPYYYDQNFRTDYYSVGGITMNIDIYSLIKLFDITFIRRDKYEHNS